jgi:hypothetical protein
VDRDAEFESHDLMTLAVALPVVIVAPQQDAKHCQGRFPVVVILGVTCTPGCFGDDRSYSDEC